MADVGVNAEKRREREREHARESERSGSLKVVCRRILACVSEILARILKMTSNFSAQS